VGHQAKSGYTTRILVADATAGGRILLREILEADSHAVAAAENAEQLLELMRTFDPDLAILDLQMNTVDAYALAQPLRQMKRPGQLPLIGLSPAATQTSPERIVEAGFSACLVKPISPVELRSCVAVLLGSKR
jgi:CheY-like chemotaxis protein